MERNAIFDKVKKYILMQLPIDDSRVVESARMVEDLGADPSRPSATSSITFKRGPDRESA